MGVSLITQKEGRKDGRKKGRKGKEGRTKIKEGRAGKEGRKGKEGRTKGKGRKKGKGITQMQKWYIRP